MKTNVQSRGNPFRIGVSGLTRLFPRCLGARSRAIAFRCCLVPILIAATVETVPAQTNVPPFPLSSEWTAKIRKLAPDEARVAPSKKHRVLLFSLSTGFQHWNTPHIAAVVKTIAEKAAVCEVVACDDIEMFEPENLKRFDAVILNNNCPTPPEWHIFLDVLVKRAKEYGKYGKTYIDLPEEERRAKAAALEASVVDFVRRGGGLMSIHGAIVFLNESKEFSELLGASFDFHPKQQPLKITAVDPEHPLVAAFEGKPFVHVDEPYMFKGTYGRKNFRPLLVMDTGSLTHNDIQRVTSDVRYVSWIKTFGEGRVLYLSPSHNAQSFEDPRLLQYFLDGLQYVLGDLQCDATSLR